jgi:P-type conjugative transfer protein TrbG
MDPRRFLILAAAGLLLSGCAVLRGETAPPIILAGPVPTDEAQVAPATELPDEVQAAESPTETAEVSSPDGARPYWEIASPEGAAVPGPVSEGRAAIVSANAAASAPSRSDAFVGGMQVFAWSPGRVFEVWAAPLRVTTLTLGVGETLVTKAAGDTVRWQIGEASSGDGRERRTHVLLKPLERGLETNLVLTTNRRVYLIDLKSGTPEGFNAAVSWDPPAGPDADEPAASVEAARDERVADPVVMPQGPLDARYRLVPEGRRPRWIPTTVFNDGRRTFIAFDPDLQVDEAPALFVIGPDGEAQLVNYRQAGGLFIVDRVFDRAELRLGDRRPQVVRIHRLEGGRS